MQLPRSRLTAVIYENDKRSRIQFAIAAINLGGIMPAVSSIRPGQGGFSCARPNSRRALRTPLHNLCLTIPLAFSVATQPLKIQYASIVFVAQ